MDVACSIYSFQGSPTSIVLLNVSILCSLSLDFLRALLIRSCDFRTCLTSQGLLILPGIESYVHVQVHPERPIVLAEGSVRILNTLTRISDKWSIFEVRNELQVRSRTNGYLVNEGCSAA